VKLLIIDDRPDALEVAMVRVPVGSETAAATASFGVAESTGLPSPETLIEKADEALYRAKNAGRNGVHSDENHATASPPVPPENLTVLVEASQQFARGEG
jgi:hypothetical protein